MSDIYPPSKRDANQVLQAAFDEDTQRLRTDSTASIVNASIEVDLSAADGDSVAIQDSDGNELAINLDGSINVESPFFDSINNLIADTNVELSNQSVELTQSNIHLQTINTELDSQTTQLVDINSQLDSIDAKVDSSTDLTTGTIAALNATVVASCSDKASAILHVTGTFVGTVSFEVSLDGLTWATLIGHVNGLMTAASATTAPNFILLRVAGWNFLRVRGSAWTSGTATITMSTSPFETMSSSWQWGTWATRTQDGSGNAITSTVNGGRREIDVNFTTLPATASTAALQTTGNSSLSSIDTKLTATNTALTGTGLNRIYDEQSQRYASVDPFRALKTAEWTRLLGGNATGTVLNTRIWNTTGSTGSGATTSGQGLFTLSTGTTANSSSILTSNDIARYISTSSNAYVSGIRLPDGGTANNIRKWGAFSATDGVYFKMNGTAMECCRIQDGVETAVTSASFNGSQPVLDTNFHTYEIHYVAGSAIFYQDRIRIHTLTASTTSLATTMHFPIRTENTNSGGLATNLSLQMRGNGIHRFGRPTGRPRYDFINAATTTVIKREPGTLHRLFINRASGPSAATVTLYDNTSATGQIIAVMTIGANENRSIEFALDFNTGLTIVTSTADISLTVMWE